jgi:ribonuclease P protein component
VLSAERRLRRSGDFAVAIRRGGRAGRGAVVAHLYLPERHPDRPATDTVEPARPGAEQQLPPARAGFVVSRAVGNAVTRNLVRRRLRHLVRDRLAELPPGAVLVVRALPQATELPYAALGADLDAAVTAARAPRRHLRRPR